LGFFICSDTSLLPDRNFIIFACSVISGDLSAVSNKPEMTLRNVMTSRVTVILPVIFYQHHVAIR